MIFFYSPKNCNIFDGFPKKKKISEGSCATKDWSNDAENSQK